ncbi:MAG: YdeI/OmpD-associated family protein [Candidatus Woesebacteria bacterium]|nr:MAG: YdeI/OmpD-associated family protein [Candidatus Woesebacteria bacterium]
MRRINVSNGVVHNVPADLRNALVVDRKAVVIWDGLTPLARNEWICWVISVKKEETRNEHVKRTISELKTGKRRPCCWLGCIHRTDKRLSPSVRGILNKKAV